ncbi:hypothetical protein L1049_013657 [Liquidambar formosana]|uniref:Uncharacterized protein n=1 Tax=Liquidambar formosana TaxID=63359 RepID=A0AAP0RM68_LIQFO
MGGDTLERYVYVNDFVATQPTNGFFERCLEETGFENFYIATRQNPTQLTSEVSHLDDINLGETRKDERGCDKPNLIGDQICNKDSPPKSQIRVNLLKEKACL